MLGKLMKYELKATSRTFLLMYAGVLFLAIINRIFYAFDFINRFDRFSGFATIMNMVVTVFTGMYVLMIIALFVAVIIIVIQRFYKNLFCDEGYLMFTLPVKSWEHIVSKMLVAAFWNIISTVVTFLSVIIMLSQPEVLEAMQYGLSELIQAMREINFSLAPFAIEIIVAIILSIIGYALPYYASISIGQIWKKHRVLGAFLAYFGLTFIMQTITSIVIGIVSVPFLYKMDGMNSSAQSFESTIVPYMHSVMLISIILSVIMYVVYFIITKVIIDKKLDLE